MWALPKLGTSQVRTVLVARLNIHFPSLSGYVHQAFIYATDRNVMSCVIYINLLETRDVSCQFIFEKSRGYLQLQSVETEQITGWLQILFNQGETIHNHADRPLLPFMLHQNQQIKQISKYGYLRTAICQADLRLRCMARSKEWQENIYIYIYIYTIRIGSTPTILYFDLYIYIYIYIYIYCKSLSFVLYN